MSSSKAVYVVTGGNSGIGYETALELARRGHAVVIGARDPARLQTAVQDIKDATSNSSIYGFNLDLSSLQGVHKFAAQVLAQHPKLAGIVCNAGISLSELERSAEGYEKTWATNHLGHFYLVKLLLPALQPPARVVLTSSGTHDPKTKAPLPAPKWSSPTDISMPAQPPATTAAAAGDVTTTTSSSSSSSSYPKFNGMQAYTNSKLCNIYMAYHLAARMKEVGKDITATAYDPGYIPGTRMARGKPWWQVRLMEALIPWVMWLSSSPQAPSTAPKSGAYQARLACDPAFAGKTGVYFEIDHEGPSSELSYDTAKAAEMWEYSEQVLKGAGVPLQL